MEKIKSAFVKIDNFGSTVHFQVNRDNSLKTCWGAALTVFLATFALIYCVDKAQIFLERGDTVHQFQLITDHFS